jgi:hypothetical protein
MLCLAGLERGDDVEAIGPHEAVAAKLAYVLTDEGLAAVPPSAYAAQRNRSPQPVDECRTAAAAARHRPCCGR